MPQRLGQDFILQHRVFVPLPEDGSIFEVEDVSGCRDNFLDMVS
jgi:hypothetical protein